MLQNSQLNKEENNWHPAGNRAITPLRAQLLCVCLMEEIDESRIPALAEKFGVGSESVKQNLRYLFANQFLLTESSAQRKTFWLTALGESVLLSVRENRPEILEMTNLMSRQ